MNYRSLLIVCLATLGLAVAGWGQTDGKIAFLSHREGYNDVWIMNADGSNPVNLTQGQYCASPIWSPDGTKIAYLDVGADYSRRNYSGRDIWVMDADGGNRKQLTDDIEKIGLNSGEDLFWSEDGQSIYYFVWDRSELFAVAPDGSGSSLVEWRGVEWREAALIIRRFWDHRYLSPDETKRAYVGVLHGDEEGQADDEESRDLFILIREEPAMIGSDEVTVMLPSGQPVDSFFRDVDVGYSWASTAFPITWAPNSTRVAFTSYTIFNSSGTSYSYYPDTGEIWAVDIDGSNLVNLTNGLGGEYPIWQPVSPSTTATSVEAQSWGQIKSLLSAP